MLEDTVGTAITNGPYADEAHAAVCRTGGVHPHHHGHLAIAAHDVSIALDEVVGAIVLKRRPHLPVHHDHVACRRGVVFKWPQVKHGRAAGTYGRAAGVKDGALVQ